MSNYKAIIDYSSYNDAALGTLAQTVHDRFAAHSTVFTDPPIPLATFQTQITDYMTKLQAKTSGAIADINAFAAARTNMEIALKRFAGYVNVVAVGDGPTVDLSGFPSYNTTRIVDNTPPNAPENLRVVHGELSGVIIARYRPEKPNSTNEVQVTLGDPNDEAGWAQRALIKGGTAELSGFAPGIIVWVRVRSVGRRGVMGVWSDPAQIRTL